MNKKSVLVTGGTGFLGQRLVKHLLELNQSNKNNGYHHYDPIVFVGRNVALGKKLEQGELKGATFVALDLGDDANKIKVQQLCKDTDLVFHCAALCESWGPYDAFYRSNYISTRVLVEAFAQDYNKQQEDKRRDRRFVFISTPSVYTRCYLDQEQINEETPIPPPEQQVNYYAQTKRMAELLIADLCHKNTLPIVTLRPRGIFGEGDTTITPRLLQKLEQRKIVRIGSQWNTVHNEITYVDNVVHACICAAHADAQVCSGQFYNITNDHQEGSTTTGRVFMYPLLEQMAVNILEWREFKIERDTRQVPLWLVYTMALVFETVYWVMGWTQSEPPITRYVAYLMTCSSSFDIGKAKRDLKYEPRVTLSDALQRTFTWFKEQRKQEISSKL